MILLAKPSLQSPATFLTFTSKGVMISRPIRSKAMYTPLARIALWYSISLELDTWPIMTFLGSAPSLSRNSACSTPPVGPWVWVMMGTPVAFWAITAALWTAFSWGVILGLLPILITPALTLLLPIPWVISLIMISDIILEVSVPHLRLVKYAGAPSSL